MSKAEDKKIKGRPYAFLFKPEKWSSSNAVRNMGAEQIGWYIQLLSDAWDSKKTPQGTLPDDKNSLKERCKFTSYKEKREDELIELENQITLALKLADEALTKEKAIDLVAHAVRAFSGRLAENLERKWIRLMNEFTHEDGLIYNSTQRADLEEYHESYQQKVEAGRERGRQLAKAGKSYDETKQLPSEELAQFEDEERGIGVGSARLTDGKRMVNERISTAERPVSNLNKPKLEGLESVSHTIKKKKELPRTLFDSSKFHITDKIKAWIIENYPEFQQGDIDWMLRKFRNAFHGMSYKSWSRTFYNFIDNQVAKYNYAPGDFDWRGRLQGKQKSGGQSNNGTGSAYKQLRERYEREDAEEAVQEGSNAAVRASGALPLTSANE